MTHQSLQNARDSITSEVWMYLYVLLLKIAISLGLT